MADVGPILSVADLTVTVGDRFILNDVSVDVKAGEALGIIGESGSGKSTLALAIMNYLAPSLRVAKGSIRFDGQELTRASGLRSTIYGKRIAHVAQDPSAALNPVLRIGRQLTEGMRRHLGLTARAARDRAIKLLAEVHLTGGEALLDRYPYELSGGMQQRVCIAMALACDPDLLVLDEPTTGLDARTEGAILEILAELKRRRQLSLLLISHNIAAISDITDRVAVLYGGKLMECGPIGDVLVRPAHRYTKLLLDAVPGMVGAPRALADIPWQESNFPTSGCPFRGRCDLAVEDCAEPLTYRSISDDHVSGCVRWKDAALDNKTKKSAEILQLRQRDVKEGSSALVATGISFSYTSGALTPKSRVLTDVGVRLAQGEVVALVGESGSGKSTLARILVGLLRAKEGHIDFRGKDLSRLSRYPLAVCRRLQIVFQNIAGSLHPRKRVGDVISRPYRLYENRRPSSSELLSLITPLGLRQGLMTRRAGALSGGERQRSALARANASQPDVIILDEAFSALDVSMKVRVARLILDQCRALGTSILFVTHDLPFVRYIADRVVVLYRGWVCESGSARAALEPPHHPYTEALVWAARRLEGEKPKNLNLARSETGDKRIAGSGCPYQYECHRKIGAVCETVAPPRVSTPEGRIIACHISLPELQVLQAAEYGQSDDVKRENVQ
jgi:peptide/nickel transport system ATP-binding protein